MDNGNLEEKRQFLQITLFQKESFQRQDYYAIGENISPTCRHHQVLFKKNLLYFELYSKNIILFLSIRFLDLCKEQNSICDKKFACASLIWRCIITLFLDFFVVSAIFFPRLLVWFFMEGLLTSNTVSLVHWQLLFKCRKSITLFYHIFGVFKFVVAAYSQS